MRKTGSLLLLFVMVFCFVFPSARVLAAQKNEKKAIILIMDYINARDIMQANTPNLDSFIDKSGTSLMNIRGKNRYPSSSYMSLASGARVGTITKAELSFNASEKVKRLPTLFTIQAEGVKSGDLYTLFTGRAYPAHGVVNLYIEAIRKQSINYNPAYEPGKLGKMAREQSLDVAIVGNADTINDLDRNAVLLAMDETGIVPQGNVGKELLEKSSECLGGVRSNQQTMLENIKKLLNDTDILFIDLGDTSRVENSRDNCTDDIVIKQKHQAIERNDIFLGKLFNIIDMNSTMIIMLSPNPSKDMIFEGNFGLAPVFMYKPNSGKGLLSSATTRREGLVSNSDLLPTVLSYFGDSSKFVQSGMHIIEGNENSLSDMNETLNFFKQLRKSRNPLHYLFMFLSVVFLLSGFMVYIYKKDHLKPFLDLFIFSFLTMPLVFLFIGFSGYFSIGAVVLISLLISMLIACILLYGFKNKVTALMLITSLTAILLTIDCFRGSPWMLMSPLGSDAIAGGRFYGIGNDYMGLLLAATVISTTILANRLKLKAVWKTLIGTLPFVIIATAIGHPHYGANIGGLITTLVTTGIFVLLMMENRLNTKKLGLIGTVAVLAVITVATMDGFFSVSPSHAGNTIKALINGGLAAFVLIIENKLAILGSTIYHSSWSIVLLLSLMVMGLSWQKSKEVIRKVLEEIPVFEKIIRILGIAAITVFVVNDTGVIAAALIVLFMIACLWLGMEKVNS